MTLREQRWPYQKIVMLPKCSKTIIEHAVKYFEKHRTTDTVSQRVRPKKTPVRKDRRIVRLSKKDLFQTNIQIQRQINAELGIPISVLANAKNREIRYKLALEHRHWNDEECKRLLFSDETKLNRKCSDGRVYVCRHSNQKFNRTESEDFPGAVYSEFLEL
ncbi:hypothetical protein Trydic_g18391 [Trypoxylus dichotomus]